MNITFSDYVAKSDAAASEDQRALGVAFKDHFLVACKDAGLNLELGQGSPTLDTPHCPKS